MVLSEFHVDAGQLTELIDRLIAPGGNTATESRPGYTREYAECSKTQKRRRVLRAELGTEHLLIAILKESDRVATRLLVMGINIQKPIAEQSLPPAGGTVRDACGN